MTARERSPTTIPPWRRLNAGASKSAPALLLLAVTLGVYGWLIWTRGFGPEDRELFRMRKHEIEDLSLPDPSTGGDAPR